MSDGIATDGAFAHRAFMSYCWRPADRRAARWLQDAIESYRWPKGLPVPAAANLTAGRLGKVCRDDTDFRAGPNLPGQIDDRLRRSEWLIVICSPATPSSSWVEFEIASFVHARSADRIILVLVDGDPAESFPSMFRSGPLAGPIAADMRPSPERSRRAARRHALLQVISALVDVDLDVLANRDAMRRARRQQLITAVVAVLAIVIGGLSVLYFAQRVEAVRQRAMTALAGERATMEGQRAESATAFSEFARAREFEIQGLAGEAAVHFAQSLARRSTVEARAGLSRSLTSPHRAWDAARAAVEERECGLLRRGALVNVPALRAVATLDGANLSLFDAADGRLLRRLTVGETTRLFAVSRDGRVLALGEASGRVRLIDVRRRVEIGRLQASAHVTALDFSADHALLAVGHARGLEVFSWHDGERVHTSGASHFAEAVLALAFAPDEPILAWTAGEYFFMSQPLRDEMDMISQDEAPFTSLTWRADGDVIAVGARSGIVHLYRRGAPRDIPYAIISGREPTHSQLQKFVTHPGGVSQLTFLGSENVLATAGLDGRARLWAGDTMKPLFAFTLDSAPLCGVAALDGGRLAVAARDGRLRTWDTRRGISRRFAAPGANGTGPPVHEGLRRFALLAIADVKMVHGRAVTLSRDGALTVFAESDTGGHSAPRLQSALATRQQEAEIVVAPSGDRFLVRPRPLAAGPLVGAKTMAVAPVYSLAALEKPIAVPGKPRRAATFFGGSDRLLTSDGPRLEAIALPPATTPAEKLYEAAAEIVAFAATLDGRRVVVAAADGALVRLDLGPGAARPVPIGSTNGVKTLALSADGHYVAVYSENPRGQLEGWDLTQSRRLFTLEARLSDLEPVDGIPGLVAALAVDRDRGRVILVDLASGEQLLDWHGFDSRPLSAVLDARRRRLLIGLESGEVREMDLDEAVAATGNVTADVVQTRFGLARDGSGRVRAAHATVGSSAPPDQQTIAAAGADLEMLAEFDRLRNRVRSALDDGKAKEAAELLGKLAALGDENALTALETRLGQRCLSCSADLLVARAKNQQGDWRAVPPIIARMMSRLERWPADRAANDAIVVLSEAAQAARKDGERDHGRAMAKQAAAYVGDRAAREQLSFRAALKTFEALLGDYLEHASTDKAESRLAQLTELSGVLNHVTRLSPTAVALMETSATFFERVALRTYADLQRPQDYAEAADRLVQAYGKWDAALEKIDGFGDRRRVVLERKLGALAAAALQLTRFAMTLDQRAPKPQVDVILDQHVLPRITAIAEQCAYDANMYRNLFRRSPDSQVVGACREAHVMARVIGAKRREP
jgi:WD40 repeat protein